MQQKKAYGITEYVKRRVRETERGRERERKSRRMCGQAKTNYVYANVLKFNYDDGNIAYMQIPITFGRKLENRINKNEKSVLRVDTRNHNKK